MRKYDTLLFDLDGTLADTQPGVLGCFKYTLDVMGIPMIDDPMKILGPPLKYSFSVLCGLDEEKTAEAIRVYRQKYRTEALFDATIFDGVEDMLRTLKEKGYTIAAATCKLEVMANLVLEHFGIAKYFDFIGGADADRTEKSEVISHVLETLGNPDRSRTLMIGDRDNDVKGASALGIGCLYALWGYGSADEAHESGAIATARTPQECIDLIIS